MFSMFVSYFYDLWYRGEGEGNGRMYGERRRRKRKGVVRVGEERDRNL